MDYSEVVHAIDEPTEKQKNFARDIAWMLDIDLKTVPLTKQDYSKFISDHLQKYNEVMARAHYNSRKYKRREDSRHTYYEGQEEEDGEWAAAMDFSWM